MLLVSEGDPYLETALSYLPDTELYGVTPGPLRPTHGDRGTELFDLIIFEGFLPDELPAQRRSSRSPRPRARRWAP